MEDFLLLIDGSSLLSTQFYGNLPREILFAKTVEEKEKYYHKIMMTSAGVYTNAVFGFLRTLFKILQEQKPRYLAVAWDLSRDTFRREKYADYKANRSELLEPLRQQFDLCQKVLGRLPVVQLMDERYEADDFCGTLSKKFEGQVPVRILTKDNDYLQLVTERTNLWLMHSTAEKTDALFSKYHIDKKTVNVPERAFCFTPELVEQEFGVKPCHINSLKGLQGDASDNIKGVSGVGPVAAVKLIQEYGTVEALYAAIDGLDAAGEKELKEYWKEHLGLKRSPLSYLKKESDTELVGKKAAFLSEELATIKCDIPLEQSLGDLEVSLDPRKVQEVLDELEFASLHYQTEEQKKEQAGKWNLIRDFGEADRIFRQAGKQESLGLHLIAEKGRVLAAALCWKAREAYTIPAEGMVSPEQLACWVKETLCGVKQGFVPDLKGLLHLVPELYSCREKQNLMDVGVAAYLLNPLQSGYSCQQVAKQLLEEVIPSETDLLGKGGFTEALDLEPELFSECAGRMAETAFLAGPAALAQLREQEMEALYKTVELPLIYSLARMEDVGIATRRELLEELSERLSGGISRLEEEIYEMTGAKFNINSPKQLGEVLFGQMKLPFGKKTKTGYSTSADVLDKLAPDYPVVKKILEYRQLTKLKSTYSDGLVQFIGEDGRIHGTFNQTITATGRISSTEPNLQNIPVRMELGREIRRVFVPREGSVLMDADYSQIELRILASMSGDSSLIEAYREARDIHAVTASQVFHVPLEEVTSLQRRNAKAVNFGIVYGISAFGLSEDLSISRKEATEYIEQYFATYPGVKHFLDQLVADAKEKGYAVTLFGRRRPVPEMDSSNFMQRSFGERVAMNSPIQGTAADVMKIAMIRVDRALEKAGLSSRIVLQVHDELLLEVPVEEQEAAREILEREMREAAALQVPLEVDCKVGNSWYETK